MDRERKRITFFSPNSFLPPSKAQSKIKYCFSFLVSFPSLPVVLENLPRQCQNNCFIFHSLLTIVKQQSKLTLQAP